MKKLHHQGTVSVHAVLVLITSFIGLAVIGYTIFQTSWKELKSNPRNDSSGANETNLSTVIISDVLRSTSNWVAYTLEPYNIHFKLPESVAVQTAPGYWGTGYIETKNFHFGFSGSSFIPKDQRLNTISRQVTIGGKQLRELQYEYYFSSHDTEPCQEVEVALPIQENAETFLRGGLCNESDDNLFFSNREFRELFYSTITFGQPWPDWEKYENTDLKFTLRLPPNWRGFKTSTGSNPKGVIFSNSQIQSSDGGSGQVTFYILVLDPGEQIPFGGIVLVEQGDRRYILVHGATLPKAPLDISHQIDEIGKTLEPIKP